MVHILGGDGGDGLKPSVYNNGICLGVTVWYSTPHKVSSVTIKGNSSDIGLNKYKLVLVIGIQASFPATDTLIDGGSLQ